MLSRRLLTIPGYLLAWTVWIAAAPAWLVLSAAVDAVRRDGGVALRSAALVSVYLTCEAAGIAIAGGLWLWSRIAPVDSERWEDLHVRLEILWGSTLFHAVVRIFGIQVEVEGSSAAQQGPYLLLIRHTSTADTLLASALVSQRHGIRLRYVLKRENLWDPCLDIVGNRVPNVFVDRHSDDAAQEIRRLADLAQDLGPMDGILLYPEGTRFSPEKRAQVLERLEQKGETATLERATSLSFVLPPRPGGALGILEAAPGLDVVVCAHTGLEGSASLADIWRGGLLHQLMRVEFRRIPRADIPSERNAQVDWLFEEWQRVDAWVGSRQ